MSIERPSATEKVARAAEAIASPEREMQSILFKGLLAVGVGVLGAGVAKWRQADRRSLWGMLDTQKPTDADEKFDKRGFFGTAVDTIRSTYETLDNAERILDPKGAIKLIDIFDRIMPSAEQPKDVPSDIEGTN